MVKFVSVVIRQDRVNITVVASTVVAGRGVGGIFVTSRSMDGIMVVAGLAIGGVIGIIDVVW